MVENSVQRKTSHDEKAVFITSFKCDIQELSIKHDTNYIQLFKGRILLTYGLFSIINFFKMKMKKICCHSHSSFFKAYAN